MWIFHTNNLNTRFVRISFATTLVGNMWNVQTVVFGMALVNTYTATENTDSLKLFHRNAVKNLASINQS
jgi:hypothetical protein